MQILILHGFLYQNQQKTAWGIFCKVAMLAAGLLFPSAEYSDFGGRGNIKGSKYWYVDPMYVSIVWLHKDVLEATFQV